MSKFFAKVDDFATVLWIETAGFTAAISLLFLVSLKLLNF